MTVLLHYVWLTFGSCLYNRFTPTNTNGQLETFCGITTVEDRLVDNGASSHSFENYRFTGLSYKLENYQELAVRRWITTAGGHQLKGAGQGLLRGHSIGAQGLKRLTQLSVLAGGTASRLSKTVPCPGSREQESRRRLIAGATCIVWGSISSLGSSARWRPRTS